MGYASDAGKNPETEQHKHTYTQPIYAKVHHEEIGHMETVTDPPTYHDEKCEHVINGSSFFWKKINLFSGKIYEKCG